MVSFIFVSERKFWFQILNQLFALHDLIPDRQVSDFAIAVTSNWTRIIRTVPLIII